MSADGASPAPSRRRVLGLGLLAAGGVVLPAQRSGAAVDPGVLDVHLNEGLVPMVDGTVVYMRGFGDRPSGTGDASPSLALTPRAFLADGGLVPARTFPPGARVPVEGRPDPAASLGDGTHTVLRATWASCFPKRTLVAETGATVRLRLLNTMGRTRRFSVRGLLAPVEVDPAKPPVEVAFRVDRPGAYVYDDPSEDGVQRVLGLHGVLLVVPAGDHWRVSPGGVEFERQWLWICHDVDPEWGRRVRAGEVVDPQRTPALPRYFTLNDRSGYVACALTTDERLNREVHEDTMPSGSARRTDVRDFSPAGDGFRTGQVLRLVNTGVAIHQLHFHGNHVWTFRHDNADLPRRPSGDAVDRSGHVRMAAWEDVVELEPLASKDVVLPLKPPPDTPAQTLAAQDCDWHYPMHCHAEMSQTAGGGTYPGGMVSGWVLAAPLPRPSGGA